MTNKPTDGTDTPLTKPASEGETPEASPSAPQQVIEQFEQVFGAFSTHNPVLEKVTGDQVVRQFEIFSGDSRTMICLTSDGQLGAGAVRVIILPHSAGSFLIAG